MSRPWLVALELSNQLCAVLGNHPEASKKVEQLLDAGAHVTWFVESKDTPQFQGKEATPTQLQIVENAPSTDELKRFAVVVDTRTNCSQTAELFEYSKREHGYWLLALDQPKYCTVYGVATVSRGDLSIGISTNGKAPALAAVIARALEKSLGDDIAPWLEKLADFRRRLNRDQRKNILGKLLSKFKWETHYTLADIPNKIDE